MYEQDDIVTITTIRAQIAVVLFSNGRVYFSDTKEPAAGT